MTSLGGKSRVPRLAAPRAEPQYIPRAQVGGACLVDHFPGTGSGSGITGADLNWADNIASGGTLAGLTIVDAQVAATLYGDTYYAGGGGIVGPTNPISGDMEAKLTVSEFSGFVDDISPSTPTPGVDPTLIVGYKLVVRMISDTGYEVTFSKQTGHTAEGRGAGWVVQANIYTAAGVITLQMPAPNGPTVYYTEIPDLVEGDVLALRVVGTILTATVNGVAVFTIDTDTDINYATDASPGVTSADLPFGAYGGFDIVIYDDTGIAAYDQTVRADDFSLCPVTP